MPNWPHAPLHILTEQGAYMVTAGTYLKEHHFRSPERLTYLQDMLLDLAVAYNWQLEAWSVLSSHYHFVGQSPEDPATLSTFLNKLHSETSRELNRQDGTPGRQVWYQFWDSLLTYERSYLARLKYVHQNPVHHGLVQVATAYPWCSAAWFERTASHAFQRMLDNMKIDALKIKDDF